MVDRPKKPSALSVTSGATPQAQVSISHSDSVSATLPTGESVKILLYGATIISWKDETGDEKLWLSEGAALDGTKAVRGGVPVVFPVFGTAPDHAATAKLPQHGFARTSKWEFLGKSTSESNDATDGGDSSVKLDFGLSPSNLSDASKQAWPYEFGLIYSVTLAKDRLTTSIVVRNEGNATWDFQVLMHTYLRVQDINNVSVKGLESAPFIDKVDGAKVKTSPDATLKLTSRTDRVYTPKGDASSPVVVSESGKEKYTLIRDNLAEVVVWNPWDDGEKLIGDWKPVDGYKKMICVEAGAVKGWQTLDAGEAFEGGVTVVLSS